MLMTHLPRLFSYRPCVPSDKAPRLVHRAEGHEVAWKSPKLRGFCDLIIITHPRQLHRNCRLYNDGLAFTVYMSYIGLSLDEGEPLVTSLGSAHQQAH